jgi:hypothetical protein
MNSRTLEILADWKPTIMDGVKMTAIEGAAPKRRTLKLQQQLTKLDQTVKEG